MRSPCCLSVWISPDQLLNAWTKLYETRYVYHGTWAHINGVLHKCLLSVCVSVCVSRLSLLRNGSVKTFPWQRVHARIEEFLETFYIRSVSYQRESLRVCLCIPPSLLGNGSVNTFSQKRRFVGGVVLYAVRVVWKESRRLVPPRPSFNQSFKQWL
jgi:hypothetical protein